MKDIRKEITNCLLTNGTKRFTITTLSRRGVSHSPSGETRNLHEKRWAQMQQRYVTQGDLLFCKRWEHTVRISAV